MTIRAPRRALDRQSVSGVVARAAVRAGLGTVHAHRLRHTAATAVLGGGASLNEVGQLLRHASISSTRIYAKVDHRRLVDLARPWPTGRGRGVNGLRAQVDDHLQLRRVLGFKLAEHERFLTQFMDYLDQIHATTITTQDALTWARMPVGTSTRWHAARLSAVRGFAAWAQTFDQNVQVPPSRTLPLRTTRATPYLYTASEINALTETTTSLRSPLWAATIRTLIGLLAVTGMRAGEAVGADVSDLDLNSGVLTIRGAKFGKTRQLPLHPSTTDALGAYLDVRAHHGATTPALLVSTAGTRLIYNNAQRTFKTLLDAYEGGADPDERLPLLATYLGHTEPANTYWYLHASLELLAAAANRVDYHLTTVTR